MKTNRFPFSSTRVPGRTGRKAATGRKGQTLVEYAMIIALIVVVTLALVSQMGTTLKGLYSTIDSQVARAPGGS